jgi:hypothetical protein
MRKKREEKSFLFFHVHPTHLPVNQYFHTIELRI